MVKADLNLREVADSDYDRIAELYNWENPMKSTGDQLRDQALLWDEKQPRHRRVLCDEGGRIIGYGVVRRRAQARPGLMYIDIDLDPDCRNRGYGSAFLQYLEDVGVTYDCNTFLGWVREGFPELNRFAEERGYRVIQHLFESVLDLNSFDIGSYRNEVAKSEAEGVRYATFEELGDTEVHRRLLHEVMVDTDKDTPGVEYWGVPDYEQFVKDLFLEPEYRADGVFVAILDGKWVGMHNLGQMLDKRAWNIGFTGVRPECRGRGIATVLKVKGLELATAEGGTSVMTHNDSMNRSMLGINERMGFQSRPGFYHYLKEVSR